MRQRTPSFAVCARTNRVCWPWRRYCEVTVRGTHKDLRLRVSGTETVASKTWLERIFTMLYTIAVVLLILWLLGLVTSTTMGGFIHILLVIAIVVVLLRVISGRSPL